MWIIDIETRGDESAECSSWGREKPIQSCQCDFAYFWSYSGRDVDFEWEECIKYDFGACLLKLLACHASCIFRYCESISLINCLKV